MNYYHYRTNSVLRMSHDNPDNPDNPDNWP